MASLIRKPFFPHQTHSNWIFLGNYRKNYNKNFAWDLYVTEDFKYIITVFGNEKFNYSTWPIKIVADMVNLGKFMGSTLKGNGLNAPAMEAYRRIRDSEVLSAKAGISKENIDGTC